MSIAVHPNIISVLKLEGVAADIMLCHLVTHSNAQHYSLTVVVVDDVVVFICLFVSKPANLVSWFGLSLLLSCVAQYDIFIIRQLLSPAVRNSVNGVKLSTCSGLLRRQRATLIGLSVSGYRY